MTKRLYIFYSCLLFTLVILAQPLAFPTAEGYGKYTSGGRGGRTIIVTNLNDSGKGSLRDAVEQRGARIITFEVDGTIELKTKLRIINDSITIAGQTAPGEGICLKDFPLVVNASNAIVRYIRVRVGDKNNLDSDGIGGGRYGQKNVILDHLSVSWSIDECLSIYKTENLTVQWCLVSHSLNQSKHTKGKHGFGGIWGGYKASFHHNLLANHASRNPRFSSVDSTKMVDYRNNVVYNWGFKSAYGGGHHGEINMVGNYYKAGPATTNRSKILDVAEDGTGRYYVSGNRVEGYEEVSDDNWKGIDGKEVNNSKAIKPFTYEPIKEDSPLIAYQRVLKQVGCNRRYDSYDAEVLRQVRLGLGNFGKNGIIDTPSEVGGWPKLKQAKPEKDIDRDGMPDKWEKTHGLNAKDATDGAAFKLSQDYTNIEIYINSLVY